MITKTDVGPIISSIYDVKNSAKGQGAGMVLGVGWFWIKKIIFVSLFNKYQILEMKKNHNNSSF